MDVDNVRKPTSRSRQAVTVTIGTYAKKPDVVLLGSREENAGTKRIPDAVLSLFPWAQRYAFLINGLDCRYIMSKKL